MDYSLIDKYIDRLITDSKPSSPIWNIEQIRQGKKPAWNYIDGCMMTSLYQLYCLTGDKKYYDFIENYIDYYIFDDGTIRGYDLQTYNLDNLNEGRILIDLYKTTGKEKYKKAMDLLYRQIQEQPRNKYGLFWHKAIYPNQVWLDGLYMAQPFYLRYEKEFNGGKNVSDVVNHFNTVQKYMYDEGENLYYHGWDCTRQSFWSKDSEYGLSKSFWLRSIGWYTVGMVDAIDYMGEQSEDREQMIANLNKAMLGYKRHVDSQKYMYYQVPDKGSEQGNYLETSGSAMAAYAMMKAARLGLVDSSYGELGRKVFNGICTEYLTQKDGELNLGGICLVAGLGPENNKRRNGTFEYYISEPIVENDAKGTGPFIMAYVELLIWQKQNNK